MPCLRRFSSSFSRDAATELLSMVAGPSPGAITRDRRSCSSSSEVIEP